MAHFLVPRQVLALYGDTFPAPTTAYFTDVTPANTLFPFVQKLRELGVTSGCTASTYCPADPVTREQMAIFLGRAFLF